MSFVVRCFSLIDKLDFWKILKTAKLSLEKDMFILNNKSVLVTLFVILPQSDLLKPLNLLRRRK